MNWPSRWLQAGEVLRRARALGPEKRYAHLSEWVLPGADHSVFRLQGEFTPGNPVAAFQHFFGAYLELCRTLTGTIAAEWAEVVTGDLHFRALFLLGVVLFILTFLINLVADFALARAKRI